MFLCSTVSFKLNSIHFHSFLALFFLSLSKNVKDAAFLLKLKFYTGFTQTCVKAVETQVLRSFYAGLRKSCRNTAFTQVCVKAVETQLLRSFYAAFTQVCIKAACKSFAKAGGIGTCVIAAFPQLLFVITFFTRLCIKAS